MPDPIPMQPRSSRNGKSLIPFLEVGRSGIRRFGGYVYEEFLPNLRGLRGIRMYREMSDNDDIVGSSLYAFERVIAQASWYVEAASNSNEHQKDAEFVTECMSDMEHSWSDFILEAASCLVYGWSLLNEVYKLRKGESGNKKLDSKYSDGRIGWRKFSRRMQATLDEWDFADNGDIKGMWQVPPPDYQRFYIPIDRCAYFRTKLEGNNPEGRSILRNAYRSYYMKKTIQMIEAIGIERDLIGLPRIVPPEDFKIDDPENSEVLTYVRNLLANIRRDEMDGVFLPPGWDLTLLGGGGVSRRQFDLDKIINRYDKRIAITMLAQFILLGMDRVGSFALSSNQNDFFKLAVQGYLNRFAEVINTKTIPRLFSLNPDLGQSKKYPKIVPGNISAPNLTELANYINALGKNMLLPTDNAELQRALLRLGRFFEANEERIGEVYSNEARIKPNTKSKPKPLNTNIANPKTNPQPIAESVDSNIRSDIEPLVTSDDTNSDTNSLDK